jgi:hypothetical protein
LKFLDPWYDLATVTKDEHTLVDKVDSVTRTFGVVAALLASLSAALYSVQLPIRTTSKKIDTIHNDDNNYTSRRQLLGSSLKHDEDITHNEEEYTPRSTRATTTGTSGPDEISKNNTANTANIDEYYIGCCAISFYSSMTATGISAVLNAWLAATPSGSIQKFVQYHSKYIVLIPGLLGVSTIFSATALCIGLSERSSKNVLLSNIGLAGTLGCCGLVGLANIRGWHMTYRLLLQKSMLRLEKQQQYHKLRRRNH